MEEEEDKKEMNSPTRFTYPDFYAVFWGDLDTALNYVLRSRNI